MEVAGWNAAAVLAGTVILLNPPARAQAGAACHAGGTVAETNACAVQDFQAADTDISVLYGDMMRALSAHERPQLRQEQSAWQRERITRCKQAHRAAEAAPEWPRLYHACLLAETQARRAGLMRWLRVDGNPADKP